MRILLIEDDVALASFLRRGLELEGHAVTHAADGEAAMASAAECAAEVIVLDLNLPRVDGLEVLRHLRAGGTEMPVLVLTGRIAVAERIACLDSGADDFMAKPFSFFELTARCRALVRRSGAEPAATVIQHGTLEVDRLARVVRVRGAEVLLTSKEFALLDYLLQNRHRAIGRPELLEKVWRMAPDTGTNVVDVYVNYLRRKLRTTMDADDMIQTVRGSGYTLSPAGLPPKKPSVPSPGNAGLLPHTMTHIQAGAA